MCFFLQCRFSCRHWNWGVCVEKCSNDYRAGETCGVKMIRSTLQADTKCKICSKIDTKTQRRAAEVDRISRWQREPYKFAASIERSVDIVRSLDGEIYELSIKLQKRLGSGAAILPPAKFNLTKETDRQLTVRTEAEQQASGATDQQTREGNERMDDDLGCLIDTPGELPDISNDDHSLVIYLGDTLIIHTKALTWMGDALQHHTPENIEHCIYNLLDDYARELEASGTDDSALLWVCGFIQRHRSSVSKYFRSSLIAYLHTPESRHSPPQTLTRLPLLSRKESSSREPDSISNSEHLVEEEEEEARVMDSPFQTIIQDIMVSGRPFRRLVSALLEALLSRMEAIKLEILRAFCPEDWGRPSAPVTPNAFHERFLCLFELDWTPLKVMETLFSDRMPGIGSIVTLTGSALHAYGTTCSEYIQTTWPRTGIPLLACIQKLLRREYHRNISKFVNCCTVQLGTLEMKVRIRSKLVNEAATDGTLQVVAEGGIDDLVSVAQQLSWMNAAMSISPFPDEPVAYYKTIFSPVEVPAFFKGCQKFKVESKFEQLLPTENSCWLPIFDNAVIAYDFPVPQRHDETGLEIPIQLMAALAGVRHAVDYDGGIVMKGFSAMLVPTKRSGDTVQWHLITSSDCDSHLTYRDAVQKCDTRVLVDEVNLENLQDLRAIVGWCSVAETLLGRNNIKYEDIKYSGARKAEPSLRCIGGSLGFQQFATASLQFALSPKDGRRHFQLPGPYRRIISAAEKRPAVLYDTDQKRAWLVRVSEVILHIAQCRNKSSPFEINGRPIQINYGQCARETLLNSILSASSDKEENYLKDMVSDIWSRLELLLEENVAQDELPGALVRATHKSMLFGYDFKAVVEDLSPLERKTCAIRTKSDGWLPFARDINAVVLLGRGFGEVLRPVESNNKPLCCAWKRLPEGHDYLATSVGMLLDRYDIAGCEQSYEFLTSTRLRWHRGKSLLFEPCRTPEKEECECERLQQIWNMSILRRVVPPGRLEPQGAVIFGGSSSTLRKLQQVRIVRQRGWKPSSS